jgi:transposase
MKILALDLGKSKTVACIFDSESGEHRFTTIRTQRPDVLKLLSESAWDRVVMEIGPSAGWIDDLAVGLGLTVEVANVNHEAWRWRNVKCKTDRLDALKLARLCSMNQVPGVYMPSPVVRQRRSLIEYRAKLVSRQTAIKNSIRAILMQQGLSLAAGKSGWTDKSLKSLVELARPMEQVTAEDLWRGQLSVELEALAAAVKLIRQVSEKLNQLAESNVPIAAVQSIPGIGPRTAEAIVAVIDDPHRFKNKKQVGSYVGLTPRKYQSGNSDRQGRISGQGNRLLRSLLVQSAWMALRRSPWARRVFQQVTRGAPGRRKVAIIAVARRLLIAAWAMLRDGTAWQEPTSSPAAPAQA